MNLQEQLQQAISIAVFAHYCKFDKGGKPYILHPLHLMNQLMFDPELAIIAVLHDVVEDSDWTLDQLREKGFSLRVIYALALLTKRDDQSYDDYIEGVCKNYDAIRVKRKDLKHNLDTTRLKKITDKDLQRIEKYHKAFIKLGEAKRNFEG